MSSDELRKGERVRVTIEGTVAASPSRGAGGHTVVPVRTDRNTHMVYPDSEGYLFEVLEPKYIPGEVYQDASGNKFLRQPGPILVWRPLGFKGIGRYPDVGEDYPERPLRKLVPENG